MKKPAPSNIFNAPAPRPAPKAPDAFALAMGKLADRYALRDTHLIRVAALLDANDTVRADDMLAAHLQKRPGDADALFLAARAALRQGRPAESVELLRRCLAAAPLHDLARFNLAMQLARQQLHDDALAELDALISRDARNPLYQQLRAGMLDALGQSEQAVAIYRRLADEHPQRAECWVDLGHSLRGMGARDEAIAAYRRAIACRPQFGLAWWGLANLRTFRFTDADIRALQQQLARTDIPPADRASLNYTLGKALEDQKDFERSFAAYAQGNAAMRQRVRYDPAVLDRAVAHQREVFTAEFFQARQGQGCSSDAPIFIVSRPRSGSTLVEQILASHTAVEGTAELPYIAALAAELAGRKDVAFGTAHLDALASLGPAELAARRQAYLERAARHRRTARPHFIDKMPANFFHVGLIMAILPHARIVEVRRHPVACELSIFKSYSGKGSIGLDELGHLHRGYTALMAHFHRVQPGRIHLLAYEDLVARPEDEIRRLLGYLGLPFEPACLNFHETQRAVFTPSSEQVRQPLYSSALDQWRHFEPWLGTLLTSLGPLHTQYPAVPDDLA